MGRTARAGKGGRVTSLYLPDVEALVGAIQDNIAAGGRSGGREGGWVCTPAASAAPDRPFPALLVPESSCCLAGAAASLPHTFLTAGEPVEGAFSRKRSFRKKLRKYGEYVPRGEVGPAAPRQQRKAELAERAVERRARYGSRDSGGGGGGGGSSRGYDIW